jgi:GNAT superfamily N-acetyltransferase
LNIRFESSDFAALHPRISAHIARLPSPIDSFLDAHILEASQYVVLLDGQDCGYVSVHGEKLITQFVLDDPFRQFGQPAFQQARRLESVREAFVPTCDEYFLSHALDDFRNVHKQAYFFTESGASEGTVPNGFRLRVAEKDDLSAIRLMSGDFFRDAEEQIARKELFLTSLDGEEVGIGVVEPSRITPETASIGYFTAPDARRRGVATATAALLIAECRLRGLRATAGCWYYNHASKRVLERAGMHSSPRLLRIEY